MAVYPALFFSSNKGEKMRFTKPLSGLLGHLICLSPAVALRGPSGDLLESLITSSRYSAALEGPPRSKHLGTLGPLLTLRLTADLTLRPLLDHLEPPHGAPLRH